MVVIIKSKIRMFGKDQIVDLYKPEEILLTEEVREKANLLDKELKSAAARIDRGYKLLPQNIKHNEFQKWMWLGNQIKNLIPELKKLNYLDDKDIDNNLFWSALGQYLNQDLRRGVLTKRSGTNKDHYRKCWLLATSKNTEWITTWGGWDAFVDRAEQLVGKEKVMLAINKWFKLSSIRSIKTRDYQAIAKSLVKHFPSGVKKPKLIEMIPQPEVDGIVKSVCEEHFKSY